MVEEEVFYFSITFKRTTSAFRKKYDNDGRRFDSTSKKKIHKKLHSTYYKQGYNVSRDQIWELIKEQAPQLKHWSRPS